MKSTQLFGFDCNLQGEFPRGGEDQYEGRRPAAADAGLSGHGPTVLAVSVFFTDQHLFMAREREGVSDERVCADRVCVCVCVY